MDCPAVASFGCFCGSVAPVECFVPFLEVTDLLFGSVGSGSMKIHVSLSVT